MKSLGLSDWQLKWDPKTPSWVMGWPGWDSHSGLCEPRPPSWPRLPLLVTLQQKGPARPGGQGNPRTQAFSREP